MPKISWLKGVSHRAMAIILNMFKTIFYKNISKESYRVVPVKLLYQLKQNKGTPNRRF